MSLTRNPYSNLKPSSLRSKNETYKDFDASELYCPRCKRAMPVRKKLLLILPEGEKYEYLCAYCLTSVGTKITNDKKPISIVG